MPGARSWMTLWTSFQPILQNLDTHHTRTSQNSPTKVVLDMEYKKMCTGVFCFWGLVPPPNLQFLCIYSMCHLSYIRWNKRYSSFIWLSPVDGVISVKNFVRHKHTHTHTNATDTDVCIQVYSTPVGEISHIQNIEFLENFLSNSFLSEIVSKWFVLTKLIFWINHF